MQTMEILLTTVDPNTRDFRGISSKVLSLSRRGSLQIRMPKANGKTKK